MRFKIHKITIAISLLITLGACTPNKSTEEYISSAKRNIQQNKDSDALIDLKHAVRNDLNNGEARALLGKLYLQLGQAAEAEKELEKAIELNVNIDTVFPTLLSALNLLDDNDKIIEIIDKYEDANSIVSPEIFLYQAIAYSRLGNKVEAKNAITQANDLSEDSVFSQLGSAYVRADDQDIAGALALANEVINKSPELKEALFLQGQLYFVQKDYSKAIPSFLKYKALAPNNIKIRLYLANTYIKNKEFDNAAKELEPLLTELPNQAFVNQLKSIIDFENQNFEPALTYAEKAIQNGLNSASNRAIAGLSAFQVEKYELAHQYLISIIKDVPKKHPIQRVLAMVQMKLGYTDDAIEILGDMTGFTANDTAMLASASFELLKDGKFEKAESLINKTSNLHLEKPEDITRLGVLKLSINDLDGVADLEKAIQISPNLPMAKLALAQAYISIKNYDKAMVLAKEWQENESSRVDGHNLAARIHLFQNESALAEQEFKATLSIEPYNNYAQQYFIEQDIKANNLNQAQGHIQKLLEKSPNNLLALIQSYRVGKLQGNSNDAISKIKSLFEANENNISMRLIYGKVLFSENDYEQVVHLLANKVSINESTPQLYWALLGKSYMYLSEFDHAAEMFDAWISLDLAQNDAWVGKITSLEGGGKNSLALDVLERWIRLQPGNQTAIMLYPYYLILNNKLDKAEYQLSLMSDELKESDYVKGLKALVLYNKGDWEKALPGLIELYNRQPSAQNVNFVYTVLMQINQSEEAFVFLKKHVIDHSDDYFSKAILAQLAINIDSKLAKVTYKELLLKYPNNIQYLNNLAWLYFESTQYEEAYNFITKALKLEPNQPSILDTAALIEKQRGNISKAEELIKKAFLLAPNDNEIKEHYLSIVGQN